MSEIISLEDLDADAIYAADHSLDPHTAAMAWPECARKDWLSKYYARVEFNQQAKKAA